MDWLRQQMNMRGLSQKDLAQAIGISEQMFTNIMHGRRMWKTAEVDAIRRYFGYTLPEDRPPTIAVSGKVGAGDQVQLVDAYEKGGGMFHISRPEWVPASGVAAAEVAGASAEPWALDGDIIFWRRNHIAVNDSDLGRPVIAELADGRVMLKRLASGSKPGLWTLLSLNPTHPNIVDVRLKWAARVLPPLPRDDVCVVDA